MPTFKVNLATPGHASSTTSSKFHLEPDKGGEGGNGIEELVEGFIPRFTEIVEHPDTALLVEVAPAAVETLLPSIPANGRPSLSDHDYNEASQAFSALDLDQLDIRASKDKAPSSDEEDRESVQDWLISIDEDIAALEDSSRSSSVSAYALADDSSPLPSPLRPPSISILGRASELYTPEHQHPSNEKHASSPPSKNFRSPAAARRDFDPRASQRDFPPHLAEPTTASRVSSPPVSAVSAASKSNVSSNPSTRVTLGAAAAGWRFDQRAKPFEREYTIDPKRARNPQPSILRQGHPLQMHSSLMGNRRPPFGIANQQRTSAFPSRLPLRPTAGLQAPGQRPGIFHNGVPSYPAPLHHTERSVNVEIRISNVPPSCTKDQLYAVLGESALHRAPFSTKDRKANFWVHLPRARPQAGNWGHSNEGFAFLTLPTAELVHRFLGKFGRTGPSATFIKVPGSKQALSFERGTRIPPAGILEWLNRVPYPEKGDRSQRVINDRKADNLSVIRLEFGVFCRDGVYSPEYITSMKNCRFSFDYRHRTFRVSQVCEEKPGQTPSTHVLVVKSSSIRLILASVEDDEYSATLILAHPPAYEELLSRSLHPEEDEEDDVSQESGKQMPRTYSGRQRRPGWDLPHQKTAGFTSRAIRFVFDTESLRNDFEDLLLAIGCPHAKHAEMVAESRRLYSTSRRKEVNKWLAGLPSRAVAFQLTCLYQNNLLVPRDLMVLKPAVENLYSRRGAYVTSDILHQYVEELTRLQQAWIERILKDTRHVSERDLKFPQDPLNILNELITRGISRVNWRENHPSTIMQCLHVVLTPTSMILEGPFPDQSNRPLRKYGHHDHFIRVAFMDEDKQPYYWGPDIDWTAFLDQRVGIILRDGIMLGGKQYDFLGYSMSSLRNRSTWFCTEFQSEGQVISADYIRQNLGDFEKVKREPARYGARMAQAFTATDASIVLKESEIEEIPDIETVYRGETLCFTDGVGRISLSMTKRVWSALHGGMEPVGILPSAFQFRLGGFKGVLTVDSALEGDKICVRRSQQKFDAPESLGLEIAYSYTTYMSMFLNRPLIKVLEDLEVPHASFLSLLKEAVGHAENLKEFVRETRRQLTLHGLGGPFGVTDLVENIGALLRTNRISPFKENGRLATFVAESLEFAEVHILRLLKLKARIPVPKAHVGVAVADESGVLKEGEIYAMRHVPGEPSYAVEGEVLLVRAPTVDCGDVQYARAVGKPPPGAERFEHIPNVVIFSIHGEKPLLTQLSRGDMDGDLVGVIYDRRLFPKRTEPAMQHKPKTPVKLPYDCTINEVIDFVLRFFRNDILGMIANRHLLIADQAPEGFDVGCGTRHPACKKLAELQTVAVDAPKSGQSVDLAEMPRPLFPHRPDFMTHEQLLINSEPDEESLIYHSYKILGKLYRAISLTSQEMENQAPKEADPLDSHYVPAGEEDQISIALMDQLEKCNLQTRDTETDVQDKKDAWYAMHSYASDLRHIAWSNTMNSGHPLSEHELFIGTILHGPLATKQKQELTQRVNLQSKELIDAVFSRLEGTDGRDRPQQWANRVLAAMRVGLSQMGNFGAATFACIAMRSCLFLLALMRDVHKAHIFAGGFQADEEEPFMPVITEDTTLAQVDLTGIDGMTEGQLANAGTGTARLLDLNADEGGEAMNWQTSR